MCIAAIWLTNLVRWAIRMIMRRTFYVYSPNLHQMCSMAIWLTILVNWAIRMIMRRTFYVYSPNLHKMCSMAIWLTILVHYCDVIMGAIASQITSLTIVYSTIQSGADQRKHQSSASLAFVRGTHRWPVNSPHKWPVTRKMLPFDCVIMKLSYPNDNASHSLCRLQMCIMAPALLVLEMEHDDVIKWKHSPVTGEFPTQRPVTGSFDVFF